MTAPTLIPQSSAIEVTGGIQRTLSVFPLDSDGDRLIEIREGDDDAGIYLDAHGVRVLRQALGERSESAPPADEPFDLDLDWNRSAVAAAIHFEKEISFSYDKGEGVIEQRWLFPKASYDAPNGTVITGDDTDRNDVRAFRLDRIRGEVVIR